MNSNRMPKHETMVRAFYERDSQFEGIFFTGVRSTGIFCRPTCGARKPKRENVTFFPTTAAALAEGFRPCKLCRPMDMPGEPAWVRDLILALERAPGHLLRDATLRERGYDPVRARRWFKRNHGMTFQAFARQLRIAASYGAIRHKSTVTDAAFDGGYESLSGFEETFVATTGFRPSESSRREIIVLTRIPTPLGPMVAAAIRGELCLLEFSDRPMLETQLKRVQKRFRAPVVAGIDPVFDELQAELSDYFGGNLREFRVPLALSGTPFQEAVWAQLRAIPYGLTRSYAEQASAVGRPEAVRAVARANGDNRIAIIVPCHRVIGSDGALTGYGGGLWRKRRLLEIEGVTVGA